MESFEYGIRVAFPKPWRCWSAVGRGRRAGGRHRPARPDERPSAHAQAVVNIKNIPELEGIRKTAAGLRIGALVTLDELAKSAVVKAEYTALADAAEAIPSPQIRHMGTAWRRPVPAAALLVLPAGDGTAGHGQRPLADTGRRQPGTDAIFGGGPAYFVEPGRAWPRR